MHWQQMPSFLPLGTLVIKSVPSSICQCLKYMEMPVSSTLMDGVSGGEGTLGLDR